MLHCVRAHVTIHGIAKRDHNGSDDGQRRDRMAGDEPAQRRIALFLCSRPFANRLESRSFMAIELEKYSGYKRLPEYNTLPVHFPLMNNLEENTLR